MCILFIYTNPNPSLGGYHLIIASNRDEFYKRPAKNAFKCTETGIIGGRDMEPGREGGMWLGVSAKQSVFKFGALLNVTGAEKKIATSGRGPLVYNYLKSDKLASDYMTSLQTESFSSYNLLMLEIDRKSCQIYHHSNSPEATFYYDGKQILGFGNSTPESPFTKVLKGREKFERIIHNITDQNQLVTDLLNLLKCTDLHLPDPELEIRAPNGVDFLSSIFVTMKAGSYGTRTHSIVLVDYNFNIEFIEHTMKEPICCDNPDWEVTTIKARL